MYYSSCNFWDVGIAWLFILLHCTDNMVFGNRIFRKKGLVGSSSDRIVTMKIKCINCGKELKRKQKYCSNKCQMDYQYREYIDRWEIGQESGISGKYSISKYIKRYLFEKHNNKCEDCGWNKVSAYTGNIPLEVEHIDGNYKNNNENNLKLLCPNCHSLTSTYKFLNKGKGRKSRKKYS